jgi:uncharacterized protein
LNNYCTLRDEVTGGVLTVHKSGVAIILSGLATLVTIFCSEAHVPESDLPPLVDAVFCNDLRNVQRLLDQGVDVNSKTDGGTTALMVASWHGNFPIASLLLKKGANVNAQNHSGDTALTWASKKGHTQIIELLKAHGAKE